MALMQLLEDGTLVPAAHNPEARRIRSSARWQRMAAAAVAKARAAGDPCRLCGEPERPGDLFTADHIHAVARGGAPFDWANVGVAHGSCNSQRGAG